MFGDGEALKLDVSNKFRQIILTGETKVVKASAAKILAEKILGQSLAGMDKTLGDLFHKLITEGSVLTELTMYGLDVCIMKLILVKLFNEIHRKLRVAHLDVRLENIG